MALAGASFGFLLKYFSSTLFFESPLSSNNLIYIKLFNLFFFKIIKEPWKYPKYMIIGTVLFSYYDWQRRIWLETLLKTEEKMIKSSKLHTL